MLAALPALVLLLALLVGAAAGAGLAWVVAAARAGRRLAESLASARAAEAELRATLESERRAVADHQRLLADAEARLGSTFRALSSDALARSSESFVQLARATLEASNARAVGELADREGAVAELVRPVAEALARVDARLGDVERQRVGAYASLHEQVGSLGRAQAELQGETRRLVAALRAPQVRGRWGELQLRRVVELAGLVEHCDFDEQVTLATPEGRARPDLVVRLPAGRAVVVDAKAPLAAWLDAQDASDEPTRRARLADHARALRQHVAQLAAKGYWRALPEATEFVVLFLPGETFFSGAVEADPSLLEAAIVERVLIATPMTLIALLRAVACGWREERVAHNAEEIRRLGRALHDRVRTAVVHLDGVRRGLAGAVDAYNKAAASIESRVLPAARRFHELGAADGDPIAPLDALDTQPHLRLAVDDAG